MTIEQHQPPNGAGEPAPAAPRAGSPKWLLPVVAGFGGLVVGSAITVAAFTAAAGISAASADTSKSTQFADAVTSCDANPNWAVVGDEGRSLTIENKGDEDGFGVSTDQLFCIVDALGAPQAVTSHMGQTTSMDGRQTESWGDITLTFSYHPDRGMDSILTLD